MMIFHKHLLKLLIPAVVFLAACAGPAKDSSYTSFKEDFDNLDLAPLEGRVIVLDPGHGGDAPGAVGAKGLMEKDINLSVSLRLKKYLEEGGATVIMTRSSDRDMIVSEYDSIRGDDLDYRVRISNKNDTDLFISLHHNSVLPMDRTKNATETYYKMGDTYTSLDAARLIHKHLVKNIGAPEHYLRPGNYYVLRNNRHTAILGEPSYLSNPDVEKRLSKEETADFEAKSYFLGILAYFSRGIPRFTGIDPAPESILTDPHPTFTIGVESSRFGGGLDYESVTVTIDGKEQLYRISGDKIYITSSDPVSNGQHVLTAVVRNMKGNHTVLLTSPFTVDLPPSNISVYTTPETIPPKSEFPVQVTAHITDRYSNSIIDGTKVSLIIEDSVNSSIKKQTKNGTVHFHFNYSSNDTVDYLIESGEIQYSGTIALPEHIYRVLAYRVFDTDGNSLNDAVISLGNERLRTNVDGYAYSVKKLAGKYHAPINIHRNGYYGKQMGVFYNSFEAVIDKIELKPIYDKALHGKRIFIDPEFGGPSSGAVGPTGLRAADENLETAKYLLRMLRAAGADARLTRDMGEELTPYTRVIAANAAGANLYIGIRHSGSDNPVHSGAATYAYPTSRTGKRLGAIVGSKIEKHLGIPCKGPLESAEYVLQQTGCPAVIVSMGYITNPDTEEKLSGTRYNRIQANAVFSSLVEFYYPDYAGTAEMSGVISDEDNNPVADAVISMSDLLLTRTDENGRYLIDSIEPGSHTITIRAPGYKHLTQELNFGRSAKIKKDFNLKRDQD